MKETPDYVHINRSAWNELAESFVEAGERNWSAAPSWGVWGIPKTDLKILPEDLGDERVLEDGCGTAYVSAWLAR